MAKRKPMEQPEVKSTKAIHIQIQRWLQAKQNSEVWEEKERTERRALGQMLNPKLMSTGGRARYDVGIFEALMEVPLNTSVDKAMVTTVLSKLTSLERVRILRYTPELNKKAFAAMDPNRQAIVEQMLVTKPGSLKLTLTPKDT